MSVDGKTFGPPWALTSFAVDDSARTRRIAVTAHHYVWHPSLVTVLDDRWQRRGTFVHEGWIDNVKWIAPNRLLVGGFSNARDGGMVALLDSEKLEAGTPIKMVVMPRTELNRATVSRFNRAIVESLAGRILARTIEVLIPEQQAVDAIYEFTPSLDLIGASFSDRCWDTHRALEQQGKLDHTRERCHDRDGPRMVHVWEPATG